MSYAPCGGYSGWRVAALSNNLARRLARDRRPRTAGSIGKHMLDIRFWREGEQTAFDVIKGDRKLVERLDMAGARLRIKVDPDNSRVGG